MKKALIAMSGGVDSSVAALLMKEAGYECIGCTMKLHGKKENISSDQSCGSADDVEDARAVAQKLGMDFHVYDFQEDFEKYVIGNFVDAYLKGMTPNPCVQCNRYMKFSALMKVAEDLGCDCIVTGHYAQIEEKDGRFYLKRGLDPAKDQSYVLYNLTQDQLSRVKLPLGGLSKSYARQLADGEGLINAQKPDSQDICFVPDGDYAKVIQEVSGKKFKPGKFVLDGKVMGQHSGIANFTIGQHRGFNLHYHEKLYVCGICPENNEVRLGRLEDLFSKEMEVEDVNWLSGEVPSKDFRCAVMTRYHGRPAMASVTVLSSGKAKVVFDEPQRAISPGQSAVFYDGDVVLGGGIILRP